MSRNVRKRTFRRAPSTDSDQHAHSRYPFRIFSGHFGCPRMKTFFIRTTKTDQTTWMCRLIWVFVEGTCQKVCLFTLRLKLMKCLFSIIPLITCIVTLQHPTLTKWATSLWPKHTLKTQISLHIRRLISFHCPPEELLNPWLSRNHPCSKYFDRIN